MPSYLVLAHDPGAPSAEFVGGGRAHSKTTSVVGVFEGAVPEDAIEAAIDANAGYVNTNVRYYTVPVKEFVVSAVAEAAGD